MDLNRRDVVIGAGAAACLVAAAPHAPSFARGASVTVIGGPAFGTYWRVTLPAGVDAGAIRSAIEAIVGAVDARMSPFRIDSEITRFNASRALDWFPVSPATHHVIARALRIAAATSGAFDPTVGPAVARFGFGPITGGGGGWGGLALGPDAVRKIDPGLTFDPCAIAKGHALDRIAHDLARSGVGDYLAELGGEAIARGRHPHGRPWQVGIEGPGRGRLSFARIIALDGWAVATSGDSINGYDVAGRRYSHIIDPATREPVNNGVAAVSVIARRAADADALATALMVMGPERGLAFAARAGVAVLFILRTADGPREVTTARFRAHIVA